MNEERINEDNESTWNSGTNDIECSHRVYINGDENGDSNSVGSKCVRSSRIDRFEYEPPSDDGTKSQLSES